MPKISVLLPVRDAAAHLEACLASLASQTFPDFEIVAVDHQSSDSSRRVLEQFALKDRRLRVVESQAPGLPGALNDGLAACQGEYVARMDADDISLPGRLESQLRLLDSGVGLAGCVVEMFGGEGLSEGYINYQNWVNALSSPEAIRREQFIECPLPHPGWMARKALFDSLGYLDDGLPEDYHFLLRAAERGVAMAKPPQTLLRWREHAKRHSRSHPRYSRPAFMRLRARFLKTMVIGEKPCVVWGAGDRGRLLTRCLLDEGAKIDNVVAWSPDGSLATQVHGLAVLAPEALPARLSGPMIACVGEPGARQAIREWAARRAWIESRDYWFAS